jgi:hypothetical protein
MTNKGFRQIATVKELSPWFIAGAFLAFITRKFFKLSLI